MASETTLTKYQAPADAKDAQLVVTGERDASELAMSKVGKTLTTTKSVIGDSLDVGSRVLGQTLAKAGGAVKGSKNKNVNDIAKSLLGAGFGLSFFKDMLGIPKMLSNPELREKQSPMIIKGAKWLLGGSMAMGLLKGVMGGAGLSMPMFVFGLVAFVFTHGLSSTYENPNSLFSKLTSGFGLRDKLIDAMDSVKIGKFFS
jgi:hypothetical protein